MRSDQSVQAFIHMGFENLQGWRLYSLSRQSVPVLDCPRLLMATSKQAKKELEGMDNARHHFVGDNLMCPLANVHKPSF